MLVFLLFNLAHADDAADALARKAVTRCGDPYALTALSFTFIVEKDGEQVVSRRHEWRPATSVTVTANNQTVNVALADGQPTESKDAIRSAWAQFVNDSYWLLAPCKLLDPGTRRAIDEQGRLTLTFGDDVGLTPGDVYRFEIDEQSGEVKGWSFVLQSGREGSFDWTNEQRHGPLTVKTTKTAREGAFVIRFADIHVTP